MWSHLTLRARARRSPFSDPVVAWWAWRQLRARFPRALAACLMPNHLHLLAAGDARGLVLALSRLAMGISRVARERGLWERAPPPEPIAGEGKLARSLRYVLLNPCRAGLASDPLEWPWSTHRGMVGAESDPWVSAARASVALGKTMSPARLHAYVSGDPSVRPAGTPLSSSAPSTRIARAPLEAVLAASLAATPWARASERRRISVWLAAEQGWRDAALLADALGTSTRSVRRHMRSVDARAVQPAALCLGDPRLRFSVEHARALLQVELRARQQNRRGRDAVKPTR